MLRIAPNLKSVIERAARNSNIPSCYQGAIEDTSRVVQLEAEMKEKHMDDMKYVERIERLGAQEGDQREFIIEFNWVTVHQILP